MALWFPVFQKNSDFMHFLDFQMTKAELIKVCFPMIQPKFQILPTSSILSINSPWHLISKLFYTLTPDYYLFPELFYNYTYINIIIQFQFSSVQFSRSVVSYSLRPHESQHTRPPCPSPTPRGYSNSCPSSRWCHPAISSSVVPFFLCPQSLPASRSFPMSHLFAWGGYSTGVSASASVPPMNTQDWSPLGWTGWSPCSPRDSQESSPTPQFKSTNFSALRFLYSSTLTPKHDHWKNHSLDQTDFCWQSSVSVF